jgi:hypothetical protein
MIPQSAVNGHTLPDSYPQPTISQSHFQFPQYRKNDPPDKVICNVSAQQELPFLCHVELDRARVGFFLCSGMMCCRKEREGRGNMSEKYRGVA